MNWITDVIDALGYLGIAALSALENLFPPIPSELILPMAGFLTGQGRLSLVGVIVAATAGSVAGALVLYALGRWLGQDRVNRLAARYGRWVFLNDADLHRARHWFDRHGAEAVLIGRLVPFVRSLISVPAGVARMSIGRFTLYTAIGSAVWNSMLISLGWALGDQWERVRQYAPYFEYGVLGVLAVAIMWFVWRRRRQNQQAA